MGWTLGNQVGCIKSTSAFFFFFDGTEPSPFQEYAEFPLWNYSPPLCSSSWEGNGVHLGKAVHVGSQQQNKTREDKRP